MNIKELGIKMPQVKRPVNHIVLSHLDGETAIGRAVGYLKGLFREERIYEGGYHFHVSGGNVKLGMPLWVPEHYGRNHGIDSIGILVENNWDRHSPESSELEAIHEIVRLAGDEWGVNPQSVHTHGELDGVDSYMERFDADEFRIDAFVRRETNFKNPDVVLIP